MSRRDRLAAWRLDPCWTRPLKPGEFEGPEWDNEWDSDDSDAYQDEQE